MTTSTETGSYALFDTPIGRCGIAWAQRGIVGVQLPEAREAETRRRLLQQFPQARETSPPRNVQRTIDALIGLLRGETSDLRAVVLDMNAVPPFHRRVYEAARGIAPGSTLSYGEIAERIGAPGSARAVGQALGRNPFAIIVPCHRVLAANGRVGGFSANGGIVTKIRMLTLEAARTNGFDGDGELGFHPQRAVARLRAADPALARIIDAVGPCCLELKKTPSLFVALAEAIVYQQLTGKAAATIFARLCALYPYAHRGPSPEQILRTPERKLRAAGLSGSKLLSLRDLARRTVDGRLPTLAQVQRMDDETVVERLSEVRGIGRWTAQMLLIFRLGRPDVLPLDDYGVRKGLAVALRTRELPTRAALEKRGARWTPYRTVASWYLWRAAERATRR